MVLKECKPVKENPLLLVDLPIPQPAEEEILVKIQICGICHTDLHMVEGELELPKKPVIPGHQVIGRVEKIGKKVSRFKEGDRVGMAWLNWTCGRCSFCEEGRENLCEDIKFTGYHADGGYAQYATISEKFAYPILDKFSVEEAAPLLCAGIIGYRALRLSEIKPHQRLGIYGFGASAHIVIQVATYLGSEVYVFTRSEEHRKLAQRLGALWIGEAEDDPPEKLHSAIIFAPAGGLVLEALRVLRKGGILTLAGIYMSSIPEMDYLKHLYYEKTIRSVTASTRRDGEEFLQIAYKIPIHTQIQLFLLEEANKALQLLKEGRINGAGVLQISG